MIYVFFNNFIDFNYMAPLLIFAKDKPEWNKRIKLVFFFHDLEKPERKIYFKEYGNDILSLEFVKSFDSIVPNTAKELALILGKLRGALISSTASAYRLVFTNKLLKRNIIFENKLKLVVFSNNEYFRECESISDLMVFSGPGDNVNLQDNFTCYGFPYWDAFFHQINYVSSLSNLNIDINKYNIIIPESNRDGELWYNKLGEFMDNYFSSENVYYIKARLKTSRNLKRFNDYFSKYIKHENIHLVYDPFFFTTVKLFKHSKEVIFFSPNSNIIRECMCCGLKATYHFNRDEYINSNRALRLKRTYLDYHKFPQQAFENNITMHSCNSEYFLEQVNDTV